MGPLLIDFRSPLTVKRGERVGIQDAIPPRSIFSSFRFPKLGAARGDDDHRSFDRGMRYGSSWQRSAISRARPLPDPGAIMLSAQAAMRRLSI
jgi:hypothetical protein